jgi:hypothetical protein
MSVVFMINYSFTVDDVTVDSKTLLMIDFVNINIKLTQSFGDAHRDKICIHVFIEISAHIYMSIYVYIVFKKIQWQ